MITMTFQRFLKDGMILVILQNNLHQSFNPILQQEIINTKCRNRKKWKQEMHVNKKWQEEKEIIQKVYEAPGMAKPKETQRPMKENKI